MIRSDWYIHNEYTDMRDNVWKYLSAVGFTDGDIVQLPDSMLIENSSFRSHYSRMQQIYADHPLRLVEVFCPLEICRQRNLLRADRYETQSQEQAAIMASNVHYDLRLDTSCLTPDQCAAKIMADLW